MFRLFALGLFVVSISMAAPVPKTKKETYYFPITVGTKWTMQCDSERIDNEVVDVAREGQEWRVRVRWTKGKDSYRQWWVVSKGGVWTAWKERDKFKNLAQHLRLPAIDGEQWTIREAVDDRFDWKGEVVQKDKVIVPAGEFEALRVNTRATFNGKEIDYTTRWFVPEYGVVKEIEDGKEWVMTSFEKGK